MLLLQTELFIPEPPAGWTSPRPITPPHLPKEKEAQVHDDEPLPGDELCERSNSASGFKGVTKATHKYTFKAEGPSGYIGNFPTALQAARARRDAVNPNWRNLPKYKEAAAESEAADQ